MRRRRRRLLVRLAGLLTLAVVGALITSQAWYFLRVLHLAEHNPDTTAFMEMRRAARSPDRPLAYQWVDYERISPWLARAVVAAEDARFMEHGGFDWTALRKALQDNLAADGVVRGGSTISQQLAKNLFLSPRRSYLRKLQEAAIAAMIETTLSKRRILELYLNVAEWGDGLFGAAAATRHYYGTSAASLTRWQAAYLAARIPSPRFYDRRGITPYLRERAADIHRWSDQVRIPDR